MHHRSSVRVGNEDIAIAEHLHCEGGWIVSGKNSHVDAVIDGRHCGRGVRAAQVLHENVQEEERGGGGGGGGPLLILLLILLLLLLLGQDHLRVSVFAAQERQVV